MISRSTFNRTLAAAAVFLYAVVASAAAPPSMADPWQGLRDTKWIAQGAKVPRHVVYVVIDPNCPYCHELWTKLQPRFGKGLQVRYVMVAFLAPSSPGKAAAILEARDPVAALTLNEKNWGSLPEDFGGGIKPLPAASEATKQALEKNSQVIHDAGVIGTPGLIYRDRNGRTRIIQAVPSDTALDELIAGASAK